MRRTFRLLTFVLAVIVAGAAYAAQEPAYIVVDVDRGTVLSHYKADQRWYPASLTKMMTAYVTFRAIAEGRVSLTSPVTVSKHALSQPPSKMGFKVGTVMNIDNALKMMLVKSANDIAVALAEAIGGSEKAFVAEMNAEARRLGMASTRFNNPNGLPDDKQVTTARDMAVLARALWLDFPEHRSYFGITAIRVGNKVLRTYNTLLERYRGTNGLKTGYICASGFNIAVSVTRRGRTLVAVVLGSESSANRAETAARLLNRGFRSRRGSQLVAFAARPSAAPVANQWERMCGKERSARLEELEEEAGDASGSSVLGPRFHIMDPVRVFTGGVAAPSTVPLPRLRPERRQTGRVTDGAVAPAASPGMSVSAGIGEPLRLVR